MIEVVSEGLTKLGPEHLGTATEAQLLCARAAGIMITIILLVISHPTITTITSTISYHCHPSSHHHTVIIAIITTRSSLLSHLSSPSSIITIIIITDGRAAYANLNMPGLSVKDAISAVQLVHDGNDADDGNDEDDGDSDDVMQMMEMIYGRWYDVEDGVS